MYRGPDLGEGVLGSHGAAPDLGVVEEEELVVGHVQSRQVGLGAVESHPLLVCSVGLNREGNCNSHQVTTVSLHSHCTALGYNGQNCNFLYN